MQNAHIKVQSVYLSMKYLSTLLFACVLSTGFAQGDYDFFAAADNFFATHCSDGKVDYSSVKSDPDLPVLIEYAASNPSPGGFEKSYLINVYNLFVISKISSSYPIGSPMDDSGFFTDKSFNLNGEKTSLDHLENGILRKEHADPRLHFALVCGAVGCPPITDFAYREKILDMQLDQQAKLALNNDEFVYAMDDNKSLYLSEIFNWYEEDFGKNKKEVIAYINGFRSEKFDESYRVQYYPYDWTLNDAALKTAVNNGEIDILPILPGGTNLQQFTAGSLLGKGKADITLFNTMYTENHQIWKGDPISGYRSTFMTHLLQVTYGITKNKRINVGLDVSFRSSGQSTDSTFSGIAPAFSYENSPNSRVGITSVGARIKVQPFKNVADFSIQSTFSIPTIQNPEGRYIANEDPQNLFWADWDRNTWWNQIFYTKMYGDFQIFAEMDLLFRFRRNETQIGMLDLPASLFLSYFPTKRITVYAMTQHVHRFTNDIDPDNPIITDWVIPMNYTASGVGFKYQVLSNLNLEFLYTNFWRGRNSGLGNTFNFGVKFLTK